MIDWLSSFRSIRSHFRIHHHSHPHLHHFLARGVRTRSTSNSHKVFRPRPQSTIDPSHDDEKLQSTPQARTLPLDSTPTSPKSNSIVVMSTQRRKVMPSRSYSPRRHFAMEIHNCSSGVSHTRSHFSEAYRRYSSQSPTGVEHFAQRPWWKQPTILEINNTRFTNIFQSVTMFILEQRKRYLNLNLVLKSKNQQKRYTSVMLQQPLLIPNVLNLPQSQETKSPKHPCTKLNLI